MAQADVWQSESSRFDSTLDMSKCPCPKHVALIPICSYQSLAVLSLLVALFHNHLQLSLTLYSVPCPPANTRLYVSMCLPELQSVSYVSQYCLIVSLMVSLRSTVTPLCLNGQN